MHTIRFSARRSALTLLELMVVMLILVAVAGILVPLLPNMIGRAHSSTGAANLAMTAKQIQIHESIYNGHPNNYDSLVTSGGSGNSVFFASAEPAGITIANATADQIASLNAIGITTYEPMSATATNKTFDPYENATMTPMTIATSTKLVSPSSVGIQQLQLPALPAGSSYVLFGVGARSTAIGKSMQEAPIHTAEAGHSPVEEYSRPLALYLCPANGAAARLVAVVVAHEHGAELAGIGAHLEEYYSTQTN